MGNFGRDTYRLRGGDSETQHRKRPFTRDEGNDLMRYGEHVSLLCMHALGWSFRSRRGKGLYIVIQSFKKNAIGTDFLSLQRSMLHCNSNVRKTEMSRMLLYYCLGLESDRLRNISNVASNI